MLNIKLYVILSILVFNLLEESCAKKHSKNFCRGGGGRNPEWIDIDSIDCKYFLKCYKMYSFRVYYTFDVAIHILMHPQASSISFKHLSFSLVLI